MLHRAFRWGVGALICGALLAPAFGQDKDKPPAEKKAPPADLRQYFKPPETAPEFWRAMQFEIEIGKFDIAAEYLKGFLGKNPTDEELLQIEAKEGITAFLRLLGISKWSADAKTDAEAKKNARALVARVNAVVKKQLGDPKRIAKFIKNLSGDPEERTFAIGELRRSGTAAVPYLVTELVRTAPDSEEHNAVLSALPYLPRDAGPPLIAALDVSEPVVRGELIDLLVKRTETRATPYLWYLSAAPELPASLRQKATGALAILQGTPAGKLPTAPVALTREAERYYNHSVPFPDPNAVTVWEWDGKELKSYIVPATRAEEYYGLRFARQALALDPKNAAAQNVFLSLALEKGFERAGLDQPLSKGAPAVKELIGTVSSDLLTAVLERALAEKRVPVVLGAVRTIGDRSEAAAVKSTGRGLPPLARALYFPDRRVQMAAADAILRIGATPTPQVANRVVEVLGRAVTGEPEASIRPKVLVAFADPDAAHAVSSAVSGAGFEPVRVHSGRAALQRLGEASDIDVLLVEAALPDPGLNPLLAQLRADVNVGRLPLLLIAPTGREESLRRITDRYRQEKELFEQSRLRERFPGEAQLRETNLQRLSKSYADEAARLRNEYRRSTGHYANVWVAAEGQVRDAAKLKEEVQERLKESRVPPLSETERKMYAADGILWLARLGRGELPGYDIQPAEDAILRGLRSDELAGLAAEAAARLAGPKAQRELAMLVLDEKRPVELRAKAAEELTRSLQLRGSGLLPPQADGLRSLFEVSKDTRLKANVALVLGSMRPSAAETGQRLQRYTPPLQAPVPPPEEGKKEAPVEKKDEKER